MKDGGECQRMNDQQDSIHGVRGTHGTDETMAGKTVITYGTFDLFHIGHLRLLERAKDLAGEDGKLIVAVSTDRFNRVEKGKTCSIPDKDRMEIVAALRCVDQVIPEDNWEQKTADVEKFGVDIFVMGDDWRGKFDFLKNQCEVVYLPRTPEVSSTEIKEKIARS